MAERDGILSERAQRILKRLHEENKEVVKTSLLSIVPNSYSLDRYLKEMLKGALINVREEKVVRRTFYISLTPRGRKVAEQLKRADLLAQGKEEAPLDMPHDFMDEFRNLGAMTHFNVKDDHIAVQEYNFDGQGNNRIVYVYTKPNGHNVMRLWCDVDHSWDCKHTKFAWTLPDVQELMERLFRDMPAKKDDQNI